MALQDLQREIRDFARARDWEKFHTPKNLAMALSVEAAELLEQFQWLSPDESQELDSEKLRAVSHEMADVLIYLVRLGDVLGIDLSQVAREKLAINEQRYPAERVSGSAKKYSEYE